MPLASPPSVAIVGAGWMGETHLRCYAAQGIKVLGLVDPDTDRARQLAERYNVPRVCPSLPDLLSACRPTGISVTSPENHHADAAVLALESGIGVLVEKPLADNLDDGRRIVEAAKRSGAVLIPAQILRFAAHYRSLREHIKRGDIGEIVGITARRDRTRAIGEHYAHVHPAYLTLVHDIDQVIWLTKSRFVRVRALEHRRDSGCQADLVFAQGELATGVIVSLVSGTLHAPDTLGGTSDRLEVYGSGGVASVDVSRPLVEVNGGHQHAPDWILDPSDCTGAFGAEIAHFIDCLAAGEPSTVVSPDDALAGLQAVDGIMRSIEARGSDVWLEGGCLDANS